MAGAMSAVGFRRAAPEAAGLNSEILERHRQRIKEHQDLGRDGKEIGSDKYIYIYYAYIILYIHTVQYHVCFLHMDRYLCSINNTRTM